MTKVLKNLPDQGVKLSKAFVKKFGGAVLHETDKIVTIVTFNSSNVKTGNMWQIWHLVKSVKPTEALKTGLNNLVCQDCPLQGDSSGKGRTCYVNLGQGPRSVWAKWSRGGYPKITTDFIRILFKGQDVRFGAYGNPDNMPLELVKIIVSVCDTHTGYTHNWQDINPEYSKFFMASVETPQQAFDAQLEGWRTFRVVKSYNDNLTNEITCLSDSKGIQCVKCGLCAGTTKQAKNITIEVHGSGKGNF